MINKLSVDYKIINRLSNESDLKVRSEVVKLLKLNDIRMCILMQPNFISVSRNGSRAPRIKVF